MAKNTNEKPKSATSKSAGGSKKGSVKKMSGKTPALFSRSFCQTFI